MNAPKLSEMFIAGIVVVLGYYLLADYQPKVAKLYVVVVIVGLIIFYRAPLTTELLKTKIGPYLYAKSGSGGGRNQ
jgi:hypothetical protein